MTRPALPPPLVRLTENPRRWLFNKLQLLVAAVALAYVGQLVFVAIYYLLFEVNPTINHAWHRAIPDSTLRHSIRDHGEGLFGGLFGVAAVWNHYRKLRPLKWYDRFEMHKLGMANVKDDRPLSGRQFAMLLIWVPLYAIPGYLGAEGLVYLIHHVSALSSRVDPHWRPGFDEKIVGYGAAFFFGRRPAKAVFDDLQLWIAERMVAFPGARLDYWWLLPTLRARCNEVRRVQGTAAQQQRNTRWTIGMGVIAVVVLALAVFGAYVLFVIA
jgi:hypothetical protein